MRYLALWLMAVCYAGCQSTPSTPEKNPAVIMAVFAHPDDETTVAPVLARYAREGASVHLVVTTDGRYGATDHAGIPAGDSLVAIRREELKCSAAALGIEPPVQLSGKDMLGSNEGMGAFFGELIRMEDELQRVVDSLRPGVIMTFGPEGDSGHPDHRLTADVVTELILSGKLDYRPALYYFSYSREQADRYVGWNLNYTDVRFLDTRVPFTDQDAQRYYEAIHCHQSQYSPEEMDRWIATEETNPDKGIYFRRLKIRGGEKSSELEVN